MKKIFAAFIALIAFAVSSASFAADTKGKIIVGSKDFTENILLSEIFAQALERAGYTVDRRQALGATPVIHAAMTSGQLDIFPEYTSTCIAMVLKEPAIYDRQAAYDRAASRYEELFDLTLLKMTDVNNSQGLAITRTSAEKHGIKTLSDLAKAAPELRLCSTAEFEDREDGLAGLKKRFGAFDFASVKVFDKGIKYEVLRRGEADVNVCFTTDSALSVGDVVAIEDDINFWPPYCVVPVVRGEVLREHPDIADVIDKTTAKLDNASMSSLNAAVDIDGRDYKDVAAEYLDSID